MAADSAADPGLDVRRGGGFRRGRVLVGVTCLGPAGGDGGLLGPRGLVPLQQQLELLLVEETLHQVQVQTGDGGPVHRQDFVSCPQA